MNLKGRLHIQHESIILQRTKTTNNVMVSHLNLTHSTADDPQSSHTNAPSQASRTNHSVFDLWEKRQLLPFEEHVYHSYVTTKTSINTRVRRTSIYSLFTEPFLSSFKVIHFRKRSKILLKIMLKNALNTLRFYRYISGISV